MALTQRVQVQRHFAGAARYWRDVYRETRVVPLIYRERQAVALRWIDELGLPRGARVLEIGCGAGEAAVELARRGHAVHALDVVPEMLALTRQAAQVAGVTGLTVAIGDVHALELPTASFDVVLALGVLPWLQADARCVAEMARVLRPGGRLVATVNNPIRLERLLDPRSTPLLAPARRAIRRALQLAGHRPPPGALVMRHHSAAELDALLAAAGLERARSVTVGFGPFTLLGRRFVPEGAGVRVHRALQRLADGGWPVLRATGVQHVFEAVKLTP